MSYSLTEDFKTLAELESNAADVLDQVHRNGRPVVITKNGKPDVVVMDANEYEWLVHCLNLSRMLHQSMEDLRAGKGRPAEEFFEEFNNGKKVSRSNHAGSRK